RRCLKVNEDNNRDGRRAAIQRSGINSGVGQRFSKSFQNGGAQMLKVNEDDNRDGRRAAIQRSGLNSGVGQRFSRF
ncbi:hypothetical protein CEXT_697071, partial [Caerostris extrusa]